MSFERSRQLAVAVGFLAPGCSGQSGSLAAPTEPAWMSDLGYGLHSQDMSLYVEERDDSLVLWNGNGLVAELEDARVLGWEGRSVWYRRPHQGDLHAVGDGTFVAPIEIGRWDPYTGSQVSMVSNPRCQAPVGWAPFAPVYLSETRQLVTNFDPSGTAFFTTKLAALHVCRPGSEPVASIEVEDHWSSAFANWNAGADIFVLRARSRHWGHSRVVGWWRVSGGNVDRVDLPSTDFQMASDRRGIVQTRADEPCTYIDFATLARHTLGAAWSGPLPLHYGRYRQHPGCDAGCKRGLVVVRGSADDHGVAWRTDRPTPKQVGPDSVGACFGERSATGSGE